MTRPDETGKVRQLLEKAERDARVLDGREFDPRPYGEARALLDVLERRLAEREADDERRLRVALAFMERVWREGGW